MNYLLVAFVALPMIIAQTFDPTKVCLPDVLQNDIYDFSKNYFGRASVDFTKNMSAVSYVKNGFRVLYDLQQQQGYLIRANGSCTVFPMTASQNFVQCLPATAVLLNNDRMTIGLTGRGLNIKAYDIPLDAGSKIRVGYTDTTPAIPVLRQLIGTKSSIAGDVLFFTNPKLTADNDLFVIPTVCPPMTSLGR